MATMGLNLLVGYTGLVSFGHSAWFGVGGYAAALAQKHWFPGQIFGPIVFSVAFMIVLSAVVGFLILRRRGVYFSLLTLALCALTFAIAFRWTAVTGGEGGLGGLERGFLGPLDLNDDRLYYALVAVVGFLSLYVMQRIVRSPFGHVLVAIRENEQRAGFQGYPTNRYKLVAFIIASTITGLAGALLVFDHRLAAAESTTVAFSGEMLAMVVIGGMRSFFGPAVGVLFYILFREFFSIYTDNWLFWFGLTFVGFVVFSPNGLTGIWAQLQRRWNPPPEEDAVGADAADVGRVGELFLVVVFVEPGFAPRGVATLGEGIICRSSPG
jgi:ABC-type branched-subunit amino acid transport system permease subunit